MRASSSKKQPESSAPGVLQHFGVRSSTGEPALLPENDHSQSEKVIGHRNSLHKRTIGVINNREETTSSESPVRPTGLAPLVKP